MAFPTLSFILGLLFIFYFSSFVLFGIIRAFTGISIQRIGLSGLRRIAYTPKDGMRIEIRGLGLNVHRPTFAQPTWLSVVFTELRITVDLDALSSSHDRRATTSVESSNGLASVIKDDNACKGNDGGFAKGDTSRASKHALWMRLINIKDKIKKLHRNLASVKLFDLVLQRSSLVIVGVGTIDVGSISAAVDTRPTTVDRSRLFQHNRKDLAEQRPAEWTFATRSVLFTPQGKEAGEILDHAVLNIHGFLDQKLEGLRDASVALKLGRLHIPYDDFLDGLMHAQTFRRHKESRHARKISENMLSIQESVATQHEKVLSSLSEAQGFVASVLRGIREVSIATSFVGVSKRIDFVQPAGKPVFINMAMKELGFDVHRLDKSTPAHSMYFPRNDVAHQALLSALSISVGVDDGQAHPERLLYVPMTTATVRTTLPSKIFQYADQKGALDLNSNVLFANLVITSPSIDVDPGHLPLLFAITHNQRSGLQSDHSSKHPFISELLPKLNVKLSVHEPVIRVAYPATNSSAPDNYDFDLLISAVSTVQLDIEASHSTTDQLRYAVISTLRVASHKLYYQTAARETHNLLVIDSVDVKSQVTAAPDLAVVVAVKVQTLSTYMLRPEISNGVRQLIRQLRSDVIADKIHYPKRSSKPKGLRRIPAWLHRFDLQASDFNVEVAGIDDHLSTQSRGVALHLDEISSEYRAQKDEQTSRPVSRRRTGSVSLALDGSFLNNPSPHTKHAGGTKNATDGRRLTLHAKGFESTIIESMHVLEQKPFLTIPQAEIALTTSSDSQSMITHVNSGIKSVYFEYSLFRHYAVGVAFHVLHRTLDPPRKQPQPSPSIPNSSVQSGEDDHDLPTYTQIPAELVTLDVKIPFIQIKAAMPSDPYIMMHFEGIETGRHRWAAPFVKIGVARLYAESPAMPQTWSRIFSVKSLRVDLREARKMVGKELREDPSIDIAVETVRIGIPHQLVVHHIFDNFVNTAKTAAQLHHRFRTESEEYILAKFPEGPKHVPKITIRSHILLFELEDGAFEWKLGVIYRTGLVEQKQRLARAGAFRIKCRKLQSAETSKSSEGIKGTKDMRRSRSFERHTDRNVNSPSSIRAESRKRSSSDSDTRGRGVRYDAEGLCEMSASTRTTIEEAGERLKRFNSQSWKKRIDSALTYQTGAVEDVRNLLWGLDQAPTEVYQHETILKMPQRPALMGLLMSNLHVVIDKPTFPPSELPDFLYRIGKGLPRDTQFGLLVPLHAHFDIGETRMVLRDYPLPLLHIPAMKRGQSSSRLPSWSLKANFVIGEEFRDSDSTRDLQVMVIPPSKMDKDQKSRGFAVDVRRTVSPVKTYSDMKIDINTARDTKITWGTSYQPAIQDMMQVIEGFSKAQIDPSDKVGFWDKIRLSFHSKISVNWTGDGDVHLLLKGSRDPYIVTGHGTGLVMIWRNNVKWNIWREEDPAKFMTVDSGDYILAVPDFSHYARQSAGMPVSHAQDSSISAAATDGQVLKKVVMKLSGKVRWQVGLVFERNLENATRTFQFAPHYDVTLKNPQHVKSIKEEKSYDAFRNFRSNHMHLSIAVSAPADRDWSLKNLACAANYNSVHLSPRLFTHFFAWWSLFSGVMALPVRQGALFPGVEKSGKKFGRHIATIKYSLLLSPLFISHMYKHKDADEFSNDSTSATGLKMRLDSFMLDLHQRREEFNSEVKGLNKVIKTSGIRINQALLDLVRADMRAVSSKILGISLEDVREADFDQSHPLSSEPVKVDLSSFTISDNDFKWVDADDLVEIDWSLPVGSVPDTKILPLGFSPRFTYRRQTDHHDTISGDPDRTSPFGNEPTHDCIMSSDDDPVRVQFDLIKSRLLRVDELMKNQNTVEGEQELRVMREVQEDTAEKTRLDELRDHGDIMSKKRGFLLKMLKDLNAKLEACGGEHSSVQENVAKAKRQKSDPSDRTRSSDGHDGDDVHDGETNPGNMSDLVTDFNNRFVVHTAQIKWNNSLRNVMLRYIHQVRQRRGFVYYNSRRAVKFILDIIEEQNKAKRQSPSPRNNVFGGTDSPQSPVEDDSEVDVQARIQQLLDDANKFVNADDPLTANGGRKSSAANKVTEEVSHGYMAQNTYHLRLIAPQIQLQSEKNAKAVVLVTARGMRLKVVQIMDKERLSDDVSGLVQTRYSMEMDNLQFFVTTKELLSPDFLKLYTGEPYGTASGSAWPPWAPVEAMFDFDVHTYGFARVVQRTSASLRYDKYNQLRLKYNDNVTGNDSHQKTLNSENSGNQMDNLWVDFPRLRAICDSTQYYAMYIIVLDLLMWSEPLEKTRHERLERIMLASDFSDLRGTPEMVEMLQERIQQLNEIKTHFHINEKYLDVHGWEDRISLEQDLASCEDELFFMMKAITTAQRKADERTEGSQANGILRWYLSASEIVWHLKKEEDVPLAEFQLGNAVYERTDNSDGSNYNCVEIDRIEGLSLLPTAVYPEIIGPYMEHMNSASKTANMQMLRVNWLKLEAIAGINVVDRFEINLVPLRIQLDYETGKKLFDYVFPGGGGNEEGRSPFMVRQKLPVSNEEYEEEDTTAMEARLNAIVQATKAEKYGQATGAGSLDARLQPTHRLPQKMSPPLSKSRFSGLGINGGEGSRFGFSLHPNDSASSLTSNRKLLKSKASTDNISMTSRGREASTKSGQTTTNGSHDGEKRKLGFLHRHHRSSSTDSKKTKDKETSSDDLTQMLNRASNYMTLAYVKIPSVVLCLSYKGKGSHNFEDVHHLVFRMPTLEYRNKTWSNLDLALALKKDVIRALISHTGAIIGNKFIHHKPTKFRQSRLREMATSSSLMSGTEYGSGRTSGSTELSRIQSATSSIVQQDDFNHEDDDDDDDDDDDNDNARSRRFSRVTNEDLSRPQNNRNLYSPGQSDDGEEIVRNSTEGRLPSSAGLSGSHGVETPKGDLVRNRLRRNLSEFRGMVMDRVGGHADEPHEQSIPKKSALKKIFSSLDRS